VGSFQSQRHSSAKKKAPFTIAETMEELWHKRILNSSKMKLERVDGDDKYDKVLDEYSPFRKSSKNKSLHSKMKMSFGKDNQPIDYRRETFGKVPSVGKDHLKASPFLSSKKKSDLNDTKKSEKSEELKTQDEKSWNKEDSGEESDEPESLMIPLKSEDSLEVPKKVPESTGNLTPVQEKPNSSQENSSMADSNRRK